MLSAVAYPWQERRFLQKRLHIKQFLLQHVANMAFSDRGIKKSKRRVPTYGTMLWGVKY